MASRRSALTPSSHDATTTSSCATSSGTAGNEEQWGELRTDNDGEIFIKRVEANFDPEVFVDMIKGSFAGLWYQNNEMYFIRNRRRPAATARMGDAVYIASTKDILIRAGFLPCDVYEMPAFIKTRVALI